MRFLEVLAAIDLDHQLGNGTVKVDDVWPNRFLPIKLNAKQLLAPQSGPEQLLGIGQG